MTTAAGAVTVTLPIMNECGMQKYGYVPGAGNCTQTVPPVPKSPELNLPSWVGGVPLVTVWMDSPLLVHLTIPFALIVTLSGVYEKSTIVTLVVPDGGHGTIWALCVDVAVKLTPVTFAPPTVAGLLAGLKVNPVRAGVMV
ncbi:MAG TPA: hypothetical protein VF853_05910 [Candidatus Deferrimicrobiaceae bacterium]